MSTMCTQPPGFNQPIPMNYTSVPPPGMNLASFSGHVGGGNEASIHNPYGVANAPSSQLGPVGSVLSDPDLAG